MPFNPIIYSSVKSMAPFHLKNIYRSHIIKLLPSQVLSCRISSPVQKQYFYQWLHTHMHVVFLQFSLLLSK